MKRYYHYTWRTPLAQIIKQGVILPSTDGNNPPLPPLVWLSTHPRWEPISRATLQLGLESSDGQIYLGYPDVAHKPARIEVTATGLFQWSVFLTQHGVDETTIFRLAQTGYENGSNPEDWFISPGPLASDRWLAVELWDGTRWRSIRRPSGSGVCYGTPIEDRGARPEKARIERRRAWAPRSGEKERRR